MKHAANQSERLITSDVQMIDKKTDMDEWVDSKQHQIW